MFAEMQHITQRDAPLIDRVYADTEQTASDLRLANRELEQAVDISKRKLWLRHLFIAVLVVLLLTLVGIVIWLGIVAGGKAA